MHDLFGARRKKLFRTEKTAVEILIGYALSVHGKEFIPIAAEEFFGKWKSFAQKEEFLYTLQYWSLFDWNPYNGQEGEEPESIAGEFLDSQPENVSAVVRNFILATLKAPFSFYSVMEIVADRMLRVKDMLRGQEFEIYDKGASKSTSVGRVLFTKIVTLDGVSMFAGMVPFTLPANFQISIIDIRDEIRQDHGEITSDLLCLISPRLIDAYLRFLDSAMNSPGPTLVNTDDEPIVLKKIYYDISCSAEEALDALLPLTPAGKSETLAHGDFDSQGKLESVQIVWVKRGNKIHRSWESTVLGQIQIRSNEIEIDVNSKRREKKIAGEVKKRLGRRAMHRKTEIIPFSKYSAMGQPSKDAPGPASEELTPEMRSVMEEQMARLELEWCDTPIPALKDKAPREAIKTREGRERLEAIFAGIKGKSVKSPNAAGFNVENIRRHLNLPAGE